MQIHLNGLRFHAITFLSGILIGTCVTSVLVTNTLNYWSDEHVKEYKTIANTCFREGIAEGHNKQMLYMMNQLIPSKSANPRLQKMREEYNKTHKHYSKCTVLISQMSN